MATKARFLYAVAPDGGVVRTKTHRDYTWAVIVKHDDGTWGRLSFHGTRELAARSYDRWASRYRRGDIALVAVTAQKPAG